MNVTKLSIYLSVFYVFFFSQNAFADINLEKELASGVGVVLVINANENDKSEQYADWSHYLNQFSKDVGKNYIFHKISSVQLDKIIANKKEYHEEYSMIFLKKNMPSYFNKGAILEPQVYEFIRLLYAGKPIKPDHLNQFSPVEIKIKFKKCSKR